MNDTVIQLIHAVHAARCEQQVFQYLSDWMCKHVNNLEIESMKYQASLGLIRDFNTERWHIKLIDNLTQID